MDHHTTTNQIVARTAVLAVGLALAVGLLVALGRATEPDGEALPESPVQGMVNAGEDSLAAPITSSTTRPVLQVIDGAEVPAPAATEPAAPATSATVPASTTTSTLVSTSVTIAPSSSVSSTTVDAGSSTTVAGSTSMSSTTTSGGSSSTTMVATELNAIELEIARLTNELRTNPNGDLRRQGAVIDCDGRVPIDSATGLYQPVAAVTVHREASLQVARPWSEQLTTDLQHQAEAGIPALMAAGIDVVTAGENIAYHNFPDTAFRHFAGWRESDGHFCNLMDPAFTHLGVGESTRSDGFSYATQNFFATS